MKKLILSNIVFLHLIPVIYAQEISTGLKKMENTLNSFHVDSVESLYDLALVKQKVELRQKAVYRLEKEINKLNYQITVNIATQKELQDQVDLTRQELEKILLLTYKHLDFYSQFGFIFSSENFSQAFKRFLFLQELSAYRKFQIDLLSEFKKEVSKYDSTVFGLRNEQRKLFELKTEQKAKLEKAMRRREAVQSYMNKKNDRFSEALNVEKRSENIINKEVKDEVTLYKTTLNADKPVVYSQYSKQNRHFFSLKGKLPAPVENSIVVSFFGKQKHPVLDNVIIKNDGIVYRTPLNAEIKSIHDGEVKRVFRIAGAKLAVLISHGNYYSLYANLEKVNVVEKSKVRGGQSIGNVAAKKKYGILKFQIWKEQERLDPADWLLSYY